MLERYAVKVARTVLRGGSGSNATSLPDHADPANTAQDRRLDSHRQIGLFRGSGFCPFRGRVSSLQPPVSRQSTPGHTRAVGRYTQSELE